MINSTNNQFSGSDPAIEKSRTEQEAPAQNDSNCEIFAVEPELPAQLPPLMELLTSKVEAEFKPCLAASLIGPLAAHMSDYTYRYLDNKARQCVLLSATIAPSGVGKSVLDEPIEEIIADLKEETNAIDRAESQWKETCKSLPRSAARPEKPAGARQVLSANTTHPTLVQRMLDAGGKFLYTRTSELAQLTKMCGTSGVSEVIRLAFDCAPFGQARVGEDGVNGETPLRWMFNASSTIAQARKFFGNGEFANGAGTRICIATIRRDPDAGIPVQGDYDEQFRAELQVYIQRLLKAKGEIGDARVTKFMQQLHDQTEERIRIASPEIRQALRPLLNRAYIIAMSKAIVLYVAHDGEWNSVMEDFVEWSLNYDLHCKMTFFGDQVIREMQAEYEAAQACARPAKTNLLSSLPSIFTREELVKLHILAGCDASKARKRASDNLAQWKKRGKITEGENGTYQKVD